MPIRTADISPDWLTRALARRYPGVAVDEVRIVEQSERTNSHARIRVDYRESAGAPSSMFCKMLPKSSTRRDSIAQTGMGGREVRFYTDIAPEAKLRVPECYVALHDRADEAFILLIEDLVAGQCTILDGATGLSPDAAAQALEDLADLHIHFADAGVRREQAAWVPAPMESDYGAVMLQYGLDHHRERITPCFAEHAEIYIAHRRALHALWHEGPHTVIHGDPHIGNLFRDGGRTGFLDWGIINTSTPMRDVSYLITMAMSIADRRASERDLLRHYLDIQRASGGLELSLEDAWRSHRVQAAYVVPACCQIVMFPDDADSARQAFAAAFLARAEAALEDLEVRDALRQCARI